MTGLGILFERAEEGDEEALETIQNILRNLEEARKKIEAKEWSRLG